MNILLSSYLFGLFLTLGVGPVFIFIFNTAALYGFFRGFVVSFGASLADGILFALGVRGILSLIRESSHALLALDLMGGLALIFIGIRSVKGAEARSLGSTYTDEQGVALLFSKSFFLTLLNPMAVAFFAFAGLKILPQELLSLPLLSLISNSFLVTIGTLTGLVVLSGIACYIGSSMPENYLFLVSKIAGIVFIAVGIYFLCDLAYNALPMVKTFLELKTIYFLRSN